MAFRIDSYIPVDFNPRSREGSDLSSLCPPRLSENYSYGFVSAFIFCTKNAGNDPFLYKKIPDLEN